MKIPLLIKVLPAYAVILALFIFPVWQNHESTIRAVMAANVAQGRITASHSIGKNITETTPLISGMPNKIVIPSMGIDVAVVPGQYFANENVWSVADNSANYAINTPMPNNKQDKTYIYGHWTPGVFGPTDNLVVGDIAYVYTTNNHIFSYEYTGDSVITPKDTSLFANLNGKPGLILMTCQGTWAQDRRLMYFNFVEAT